MGSTTPIYGIPYPSGTDYVKDAPTQMQTLAEGMEKALSEVDARATPKGATPAIATTYAALAAMTGVTGQTGYVYSDPTSANNGPYVWTRTEWRRIRTLQIADIEPTEWSDSTWRVRYACRNGVMWIYTVINSDGDSGWAGITCPWTVPDGYRPLLDIQIQPIMQNYRNLGSFDLLTDGTLKYSNLGGSRDGSDARVATFIYPVPTTGA